jgi:hypothetical protein
MLSPNEFAGKVLTSLEEIRERVASVETETRHIGYQVNKLEADMEAHAWAHCGQRDGCCGADTTIRLNRKALDGASIAGGGIAAAVIGVGKVLGWW